MDPQYWYMILPQTSQCLNYESKWMKLFIVFHFTDNKWYERSVPKFGQSFVIRSQVQNNFGERAIAK